MKKYINEIIRQVESTDYSAFFYTPVIYENGNSYIFTNPSEIIEICGKDNFNDKIKELERYVKKGLTGYGMIDYETGYLLEEKLSGLMKNSNEPVARFYLFKKENVEIIKSEHILFKEKDFSGYKIENFSLNTCRDEYLNSIAEIKKYIEAGDTYQVNYTVKGEFDFTGNYSDLFSSMVFNQSAEYCAFINSIEKYIISASPELFFRQRQNKITAQPMKGTIPRGYCLRTDNENKNLLMDSSKDQAENIMIVDMLRNDLGIISKYDSVKTNSVFNVLKYETVFQMVSTVSATLKENSFSEIIMNIFPCGSITGAPKIRTMQIINKLEKEKRGLYTGSIGLFTNEETVFNVAIRTVEIEKTSGKGEIGIGSGIVWDSNAEYEYNECLLKSRFITLPDKYFYIFESFLVENGQIFLETYHFERLKKSADFFLFKYNEKGAMEQVNNYIADLDKKKKYKIRLKIHKWGNSEIESDEIEENGDKKLRIYLSEDKINSLNKFQYFKTSNREFYDTEFNKYCREGFDDVLFMNEKSEIAETARTNIFIKIGNETFTPPVSAGILNGCFRRYILENNESIKEHVLTLKDLLKADEIFLANSVRKRVCVGEIYLNGKLLKSFPS